MVEKLAISEGVCNHISDKEAMLSKMNWSKLIIIHVRVAKTSEHYRGKLAFLPAGSVFKEAQYKDARPTFFFFFNPRQTIFK